MFSNLKEMHGKILLLEKDVIEQEMMKFKAKNLFSLFPQPSEEVVTIKTDDEQKHDFVLIDKPSASSGMSL